MLYTLVTDRVFIRESSVVWESLVDVDGQSSSFYDSFITGSTPAGGDFAGHTAEQIARMHDKQQNDAALSVEYV
jgi:ubiquitin carboxyl-terminal hydrolase MINDY-1/2